MAKAGQKGQKLFPATLVRLTAGPTLNLETLNLEVCLCLEGVPMARFPERSKIFPARVNYSIGRRTGAIPSGPNLLAIESKSFFILS